MDPGHVLLGIGLFFLTLWAVVLIGWFYQRRQRDKNPLNQAPR